LENGSCVGRESGAFYLLVYFIGFPAGIMQFLSGELVLADLGRQSVFALFFLGLFFLPFISSLLRVRPSSNKKHRAFHIIVWGLAAVLGLFVALSAEIFHPVHLWGIWLYILLAVGMLAFELLPEYRPLIPGSHAC
jgi:phosphatidylserine synthase